MRRFRLSTISSFFATSLLLAACGGGGGAGDIGGVGGGGGEAEQKPNITASIDTTGLIDDERYFQYIGDNLLLPALRLNSIDNIFNDHTVNVQYESCGEGVVNAFYQLASGNTFICDELTQDAYGRFVEAGYGDASEVLAVAAVTFVTFHELGHAVVHQNELALSGNSESIADAMGVVLGVETGEILSGFGGAQLFLEWAKTGTPNLYVGKHPANEDRAGDITCWWLGGSQELVNGSDYFTSLANQFIQGGRDCVGEYATQRASVIGFIPEIENLMAAPAGANPVSEEETALKQEALQKVLISLLEDLG